MGLEKILFDDFNFNSDSILLIITIEEKNLNIKELSSYLDFIYRSDGALNTRGFQSYSQTPRNQIEITRIKQGSWQLIIERFLASDGGQNLLTLFLVLRYLPKAIKAVVNSSHTYYKTLNVREDYLAKKSKRKFRSPLKKAIFEDNIFSSTSDKEKEKLYKTLKSFYEKKNLPAVRFSKKHIKKIEIKPKK